MEKLNQLINDILINNELIEAVLSDTRKKIDYNKVSIKPFISKTNLYYQFSFYYDKKVLHQNLDIQASIIKLNSLFQNEFKKGTLFTVKNDIQILISKKFKITILNHSPTKQYPDLVHDRTKNYLIEQNKPADFLIELGVMNRAGKVLSKKYDKFKQINRFLEMIEDILPYLKTDKQLNIIDFGCGKSYLTFALYYYLKKLNGYNINIVGLDLKQEVIDDCNSLVKKLNWDKINFCVGDIANYIPKNDIDVVVTLHACDTATDAALQKAICWNANIILSVPCCQHELNAKIKNDILEPMLKYGILKERFSALATDAIRANLLEIAGYKVQILEFIDIEHTPKNILIRAIKDKQTNTQQKIEDYKEFKNFLNANLYLQRALEEYTTLDSAVPSLWSNND